MRRRTPVRQLALPLWITAAVAMASCATAPPTRTATPAIHELRDDYFRSFPEGPNNEHIRRGEVVKGMTLFEVLASWGIPDARLVSDESSNERWIYVLLDDLSMDWVCYEYEFTSNALIDWTTTRNVSNGLPLDTPDLRRDALSLPGWASSQQTGPPVR
jgi:hypothetical protein